MRTKNLAHSIRANTNAKTLPTSITIAPSFAGMQQELLNIDAAFAASDDVLHAVRNTIKRVEIAGTELAVKSFRIPRWPQSLIYARWRESKAGRSFRNAHELLNVGVATPEPVACIQTIQRGRLGKSYYVSVYFRHDFSIQQVLDNAINPNLPEATVQSAYQILAAFVQFTHTMHEAGALHMDHNAGNTLVRLHKGNPEFAVIDINRMRFGRVNLRARLNNFVRLTDSKAVMEFIAQSYAELAGQDPQRCKQLLFRLKQKHLRRIAVKKHLKKLLGIRAGQHAR